MKRGYPFITDDSMEYDNNDDPPLFVITKYTYCPNIAEHPLYVRCTAFLTI